MKNPTINRVSKIEKCKIKNLIYAEYEKNGLIEACDWATNYNKNHISVIPFEWCEACDNHTPSIDHECCCCGQKTKAPSKPKFYQAVLKPIKGNVLDHVYPHLKGDNQMDMAERMGNENASCPECGGNHWYLLPNEGVAVMQGGKPYIECLGCGYQTHL